MSDFRPSSFQVLPLIVKNLLIINGLFFLASLALQNYGVDLSEYLGLHYFTSQYFRPHQLITHMFMHGGFEHILFNMFALWMFGSVIENVWGPKRFLIFYMICGLGGALCHLGVTAYQIHLTQNDINAYMASPSISNFNGIFETYRSLLFDRDYVNELNRFLGTWGENPSDPSLILQSKVLVQQLTAVQADIPVIGASGAIFGVLLAFGMMFPNTYLYLYFLVPVKAKYMVIALIALELYLGVTGTQAGVAHFAHLGGALFGYIMIKYWNKNRRQDFF